MPKDKSKNFLQDIFSGNPNYRVLYDRMVVDEDGNEVGRICLDGRVVDKHCNEIGRVCHDMKVVDKNWNELGRICPDGKVVDKNWNEIDGYQGRRLGHSIRKKCLGPIEKFLDYGECFVATAVYGDKNAQQVQTLRELRDNVLMQSSIGRAFVDFYYSGAGKRTADFIIEHLPSAIPAIRRGLDILVERYSSQRK